MVRIDMSEYVGCGEPSDRRPAGTSGSRRAGSSPRRSKAAVQRRLFGEMEKAHGDVFNVCSNPHDGRVTDSQGRVGGFEYILIDEQHRLAVRAGGPDPGPERQGAPESVMDAVRQHFRPEFVNGVDEYAVFDRLDFSRVRKIVAQQVERVRARLVERKIGLYVGEDAVQLLCEAG